MNQRIRVSIGVFFIICLLVFGYGAQGMTPYPGFAEIDPSRNRFIIVGDTQRTSYWECWREKNDRERKIIIDEIARRDPVFVLHLGDLTARGGSEKQWREFDELNRVLLEKKIPYFPIPGNHDLYGNKDKALRNYFERFPHLENRRWYSFTWKNIGLIMVDCNFSNLTPEQVKRQDRWYLGELERFEKDERLDYVIACCHEPPFTNSRVVHPNKKVKASFADPFIQFHKTCLFFSGHSHTYERFQIEGKFFIVSGGGGGPRQKVHVDPERQRFKDQFSGPALRFFHVCELEVGEQGLLYRVLRLEDDGKVKMVDSIAIRKSGV
jgi:predicted phosphodiesterase